MEGHFLLFDSECPQCTRVAKRLRELNIRDLSVKSLHDPQVDEQFAQAGRPLPDKPALVHATAQGMIVYTGFAMRMRLARMLGVRRAADIAGLVAMEARAHLTRRDSDDEHRLSRRTMLGGTAAAGVGALVFGAAAPAAAEPAPQAGTPLDAAAKQRLLDSTTVQRARGVWGAIDEAAITTSATADGRSIVMVPHNDTGALTVVGADNAAPAVTITANPNGDGIRYFLAESGTPLAEQTVRGEEVVTAELDASAAPSEATPAPQGVPQFTACFVLCVGRNVTASCVINCVNCARGGFGAITNCPRCAACAGALGLRCARSCAHEL